MLALIQHNRPLGITLIYLVLGLMWIIAGDQIALLFFSDNVINLTTFQILKGCLFVILTAIVIYLLIRNLFDDLYIHKEDLKLIYSNPKLGILKVDQKGNIKECSRTIYEMLDYTKNELLNKNYFQHIYNKDRAQAEQFFNKLESGDQKSFNCEQRLLNSLHEPIWVVIHGTIKRGTAGTDYFLISIQNIEERKSSEQQLDQELREKNALINNTNDMIWSIDSNYQIVSYNKAYSDAIEYATGKAVSKGDYVFIHGFGDEKLQKWEQYYKRALSGEQFTTVEDAKVQGESLFSQLSFHPMEEDGEIIGVSCFGRNITKLVMAQKKLKEREEYLEVLTNHASDAIVACDQNEEIQFYNQTFEQWCMGESPSSNLEEWPEKYGLYSMETGQLLKKEDLALWQALHKGRVRNHETAIKRPGEPTRYIQANGASLIDSDGNKIGAMVAMRDITDRIDRDIQVSNRILNSREEERTMIASELHDGITQLLGIVNMNLKNIALEHPDLKDSKRFDKAMEQLQNAIEESRDMAHRIMPKSIQDFGLVLSIQELIDDLKETTNLELDFSFNKDIRINQEIELNVFRIIQEAVNNCLEHANANELSIHLEFINDYLFVEIEDNGCGFDPENDKDFGIGLRTMKNRAKKMDAIFNIHSSQEGTKIQLKTPIKIFKNAL